MKTCSKCNNILYMNTWNKINKERYIDNKTKILERHISYRNKNRKKIKDYSKKHSVLYKDRKNQIRKERRINDINFRITDRLRSRIRLVLKNISKSDNTMNLLGCSIEQLKNHLQNTAISNGYGDFDINNFNGKEYHIDHIVPVVLLI